MSSNDYIHIKQSKDGKNYTITHRDADTRKVIKTIAHTKNLRTAINKAEDYQVDMGFTEYGLHFEWK